MIDESALSATLLFAMRQKATNFGSLVTGLMAAIWALRPNSVRQIIRQIIGIKEVHLVIVVLRDPTEKRNRVAAFSAFNAWVGLSGDGFLIHGGPSLFPTGHESAVGGKRKARRSGAKR